MKQSAWKFMTFAIGAAIGVFLGLFLEIILWWSLFGDNFTAEMYAIVVMLRSPPALVLWATVFGFAGYYSLKRLIIGLCIAVVVLYFVGVIIFRDFFLQAFLGAI